MLALAGSLYVVATAAFALTAGFVGVRLLLLARTTRQQPEALLGGGLLCTAGLGYGLLIAGVIGNQSLRQSGAAPSSALTFLSYVGWLFHNLGVMLMLRFTVVVFRPGVRWARTLSLVMSVVLWLAWGLYAAGDGISSGRPDAAYWLAMTVIGTYPLWVALESFAYYRRTRRQRALGLCEPLVCNRFLLWSLASLSALASIWTVNVPTVLLSLTAMGADATAALSTVTMLVTAGFGITTVLLYLLTFMPPDWYVRRFEGEATA